MAPALWFCHLVNGPVAVAVQAFLGKEVTVQEELRQEQPQAVAVVDRAELMRETESLAEIQAETGAFMAAVAAQAVHTEAAQAEQYALSGPELLANSQAQTQETYNA